MQLIWLLGGLAAAAMLVAAWALARVRAAVSSRQRLVEAVQDLGEGELSRRLDEDEVGTAPAAAFNQAARNLDLRQERSRLSLARMRSMVETATDGVLLSLNVEDEVEEVLGDLEGLTGHAPPLVAGRHGSFFFASEQEWERLAEGNMTEVFLRRQDGELVPGRALLLRRSDDHAHLQLLAGAGEPVGEEGPAPAAEELPQTVPSEDRFAAFAGALPDGLAVVSAGQLVSVSPRLLAMLGAGEDEVVGKPLMDLVQPADAVAAAALVDAGARPVATETELRFRRPHGQSVTLALTVGRLEVDGRCFSLLAARDVSQSRSRHQRLERSAAWLSAALEASPDGLAVLPVGGGRPAVANDRFLRRLGLEADRLPTPARLAEGFRNSFADPLAVQEFLAAPLAADGSGSHTTVLTRGEPGRRLRLARLPVHDRHGSVQGALLVLRDIGEEQDARQGLLERLEAAEKTGAASREECERLAAQRSELESKAGGLLKENQDLRQREEVKNNMLGNFAHEMQNPLVSIRGYNEMMLRGDLGGLTGEQKEGLEIALRNAKRLASLVDQLSLVARTEDALSQLTLESFPIWTMLEENISLLGDRVKAKQLEVTTRYRTQRLNVMADRDLISQVLSNVLGNAVKYSRQGGQVEVTVRSGVGDELIVDVRDTGVGIPREEQDRVFQRGFRASTAGTTRGSGIGLALVEEILKRHGCQIRVDSRAGEGSTFSFTLPLAADEGGGSGNLQTGNGGTAGA